MNFDEFGGVALETDEFGGIEAEVSAAPVKKPKPTYRELIANIPSDFMRSMKELEPKPIDNILGIDIKPVGKFLNDAGEVANMYAGWQMLNLTGQFGDALEQYKAIIDKIAGRKRPIDAPLPPYEAGTQALPPALKVVSEAGQGLVKTSPRLAAMAGASYLGVGPMISGGLAFGFTENGFDPKEAVIAAMLPGTGKMTGEMAEIVGAKLGMKSEVAQEILHRLGGVAGAVGLLGYVNWEEIQKLPQEQRKQAFLDSLGGLLGQSILGMLGGRTPRPKLLDADIRGSTYGSQLPLPEQQRTVALPGRRTGEFTLPIPEEVSTRMQEIVDAQRMAAHGTPQERALALERLKVLRGAVPPVGPAPLPEGETFPRSGITTPAEYKVEQQFNFPGSEMPTAPVPPVRIGPEVPTSIVREGPTRFTSELEWLPPRGELAKAQRREVMDKLQGPAREATMQQEAAASLKQLIQMTKPGRGTPAVLPERTTPERPPNLQELQSLSVLGPVSQLKPRPNVPRGTTPPQNVGAEAAKVGPDPAKVAQLEAKGAAPEGPTTPVETKATGETRISPEEAAALMEEAGMNEPMELGFGITPFRKPKFDRAMLLPISGGELKAPKDLVLIPEEQRHITLVSSKAMAKLTPEQRTAVAAAAEATPPPESLTLGEASRAQRPTKESMFAPVKEQDVVGAYVNSIFQKAGVPNPEPGKFYHVSLANKTGNPNDSIGDITQRDFNKPPQVESETAARTAPPAVPAVSEAKGGPEAQLPGPPRPAISEAKPSGEKVQAPVDLPEPAKASPVIAVATPEVQVDGIAINAGEGVATPMFSGLTWAQTDRAQLEQDLVRMGIASPEKARKWIDDINNAAAIIARNREQLDYNASAEFTALKGNADKYYTLSEDYSTICRKGAVFAATVSDIQTKLGRGLTVEEMWKIRDQLKAEGETVACAPCYVWSRKIQMGNTLDDIAAKFPNVPAEVIYDLSKADILKRDYPDAWAYLMTKGSGIGKSIEVRTAYDRDIIKNAKTTNPEWVKRQNQIGGLRSQSWSDFEIMHLIDKMQSAADKALVGLMGQSYTKVPEYVEVVGHTGEMVNMSIMPKGNGLENGKLVFDDVEGMPASEAFRLREKFDKTASTVLIGANDAHIIAAMADPRIDYIIPYHKSGLKSDIRARTPEMENWTDYESNKMGDQREHIADPAKYKKYMAWKTAQGFNKAQTEIRPWEYWDKNATGDENGARYVKYAQEHGITPKFPQFIGKPGYWKLLVDRRMYDANGKYVEQQVVKPEFDMDMIRKIYERHLSGEWQGAGKETPNAKVVEAFLKERRDAVIKDADIIAAFHGDVSPGDIFQGEKRIATAKDITPEQLAGNAKEAEMRVPGFNDMALRSGLIPDQTPDWMLGSLDRADAFRRGLVWRWNNRKQLEEMAYTKGSASNEAAVFAQTVGNQVQNTLLRDTKGTARPSWGSKERWTKRLLPGVNPNAVVEEALTFVRESGTDPVKLREMRDRLEAAPEPAQLKGIELMRWRKMREKMVNRMDYALGSFADFTQASNQYGLATVAQVLKERQNGMPTPIHKNYVMHAQDVEGAMDLGIWEAPAGGGGAGSQQFRKARKYETLVDSMVAGVRPESINAIDLLKARLATGQRLLNNRAWMEHLKTMVDDTGKPIAMRVPTQNVPGPFPRRNEPNVPIGYETVELGGTTLAVRKGYSGLFKALSSPSRFSSSPLGRTLMDTAHTGKHVILLLDTYHLARLSFWEMISRRSIIPRYARGLNILDNTIPELHAMAARGEIPQRFLNDIIRNKHLIENVALKTGFNVGGVADNLYSTITEHVPIFGAFNKFLFREFQRGAMVESWLTLFAREKRANPHLTDMQVGRMVSKTLNIRFGALNDESVFKSRTLRDLTRLMFLAPQWNEALIRSELGAMRDFAKMPVDLVAKQRVYMGSMGKIVGSMILFQFVANQIINMATRGHPTWQNPEEGEDAKLSAWIPDVTGGDQGYFLSPVALPLETMHLLYKGYERSGAFSEAARRYIASRLGYITRPLYTGMAKRDEFDRLISKDEYWSKVAMSVVPKPIAIGSGYYLANELVGRASAATKGEAYEGTRQQFPGQYQKQFMSSMGVKTENAPSDLQRIYRLADEFNKKNNVEETAEYFPGKFTDLNTLLRAGNFIDAKKEMENIRKEKTDEEIIRHYRLKTRFTRGKKQAEGDFFDSLNPEQQALYDRAKAQQEREAARALELLGKIIDEEDAKNAVQK